MSNYKIYYHGSLLGETRAVSKAKAINNMRYRCGIFAPISNFTAIEV